MFTLPEQVCTEPSPMRKFKVVGWPVENQATPAGGLGGGEHILALTPTTSALGVSTVLPRTRLLAVVPQGLVPAGPLPPPPPRPPQHCTWSPARMVLDEPADMAAAMLTRGIVAAAGGKTPPFGLLATATL